MRSSLRLSVRLKVSPKALVEEFIKGREATVGVIDNFRGEKNVRSDAS